MFTEHEKKTVRRIRKWLGKHDLPYMFWFNGNSWEGGFGSSLDSHFRNQYTIPAPHKHIVKNW